MLNLGWRWGAVGVGGWWSALALRLVVGVAVAVGVTCGMTVVISVAELLDGLGSPGKGTLAVLLSWPATRRRHYQDYRGVCTARDGTEITSNRANVPLQLP